MSAKVKSNRFFCHVKMCRKTAWDTPEHLSDADWQVAQRLLEAIQGGNVSALCKLLNDHAANDAIFDRILGWPEGANYCRYSAYLETTGLRVMQRTQGELQSAIASKLPPLLTPGWDSMEEKR